MSSKNDKIFSILSRMLSKEKLSKLEREIIYQDPDGTYRLFGEYSISKQGSGYLLTKNATYTTYVFTELKNAVTWVTFDKSNYIMDASRVLYLDSILHGTLESLKIHQKLAKSGKNLEARSIMLAKLNEDILKKQRLMSELESFVKKANAWQHKQFALNSAK